MICTYDEKIKAFNGPFKEGFVIDVIFDVLKRKAEGAKEKDLFLFLKSFNVPYTHNDCFVHYCPFARDFVFCGDFGLMTAAAFALCNGGVTAEPLEYFNYAAFRSEDGRSFTVEGRGENGRREIYDIPNAYRLKARQVRPLSSDHAKVLKMAFEKSESKDIFFESLGF